MIDWTTARRGILGDRLATRLALLIMVALLPLGLLAVAQTRSLAQKADENALLAVMGETVNAAAPDIRLIRTAQAMARTLASAVAPYVDQPDTCRRMMEAAVQSEPRLSLAAYVPLSGQMTCSSNGRVYDYAGDPLFDEMRATPEAHLIVNQYGPVSGRPIVGISYPVFDAAGTHVGVVSLSIPHESFRSQEVKPLTVNSSREPVALITFDSKGTILTASAGLEEAPLRLPANRSLTDLASSEMQSFIAPSAAGNRRVFSVVPIAGGMFLLGTWKIEDFTGGPGSTLTAFVIPALMWLAGLAVAILASERLVTRHARHLSRNMMRFAKGDRRLSPLRLDTAPAELRDLGEAYVTMAETVRHDEAELENLLRQKELLLREVHHRTGNSLQLIASILRMHQREAPSDEVRAVLDGLHDRVIGLATVHLGLYKTIGQPELAMDDLFADVVRQIRTMLKWSGRDTDIRVTLDPLRLPPEQAIPLALLLAEVLSGFPKISPDAPAATLEVGLRTDPDGAARLTVCGPTATEGPLALDGPPGPAAIGARLIRSFVDQLGGEATVSRAEDRTSVSVRFPIRQAATHLPEPEGTVV